MTSRPSTAAPILAVLAIVLVTLGAYVGGYLWMGETTSGTRSDLKSRFLERNYARQWQAFVFQPLGALESKLRGMEVEVGSDQ